MHSNVIPSCYVRTTNDRDILTKGGCASESVMPNKTEEGPGVDYLLAIY